MKKNFIFFIIFEIFFILISDIVYFQNRVILY